MSLEKTVSCGNDILKLLYHIYVKTVLSANGEVTTASMLVAIGAAVAVITGIGAQVSESVLQQEKQQSLSQDSLRLKKDIRSSLLLGCALAEATIFTVLS